MSGAGHPAPAVPPDGGDPAGKETIPVSRRAAMELRLLALERSLASGERPDVSEVLDDLLAAYGGGPEARAAAAAPRGPPPPRPWLLGACALLLAAVGTVVAFSAGPERPAAVADPPTRLSLPAGPMAARGGAGAAGGPQQEAAAGSAARATTARGREVCVYRGAAERACATFD